MAHSVNDEIEVPDDAIRVSVAPDVDLQYVAGSRHAEEEEARTRLASLVAPDLYKVLMAALEPSNRIALQLFSRDESEQLFRTLVQIKGADRAADLLETSKEAAKRYSLLAHVALVDPATLNGVRARIVRDERMTPSALILLPRNTATPEDLAAGIAAMTRLRRIYGDAILYGDETKQRVEMDVLEFRATLSPAQTALATQILKSAMVGSSDSLPGFGDASMTSVRLSPLKP
jgi:hypothetical protein